MKNLWYQLGTTGAPSGIEAIADFLRPKLEGYKCVFALGTSMGGYAALALMPLLPKISLCLAMGPQTFLDNSKEPSQADN